jgi:hypothetical protein
VDLRAGPDDLEKRKFLTLRGLKLDNIKMDLRDIGWDGLIWRRIGTSGGIL